MTAVVQKKIFIGFHKKCTKVIFQITYLRYCKQINTKMAQEIQWSRGKRYELCLFYMPVLVANSQQHFSRILSILLTVRQESLNAKPKVGSHYLKKNAWKKNALTSLTTSKIRICGISVILKTLWNTCITCKIS